MKTAIIYTRVSTDEQAHGYSLRAQKEELERYAAQQNITVVAHYEDDASAKSFNRPEFQKLLQYLKKHKGQVDYLLVNKWDRFSRNITESLNMIRTLNGLQVEANATSQWIDFAIPENLLMLSIYLSSPEVENMRRGMNISAGINKAKKEGRYCGNAPIGYAYTRDTNNKPILTPNAKGALIRAMLEEYVNTTISKQDLRRKYNRLGLSVGKSNVDRVFTNALYAGMVEIPATKDEPYRIIDAVHEPLISKGTYYRIQEKLKGKKYIIKHETSDHLPLRGAICCTKCGHMMTGSGSKGRSGKRHYYYHCNNSCKERINVSKAHAYIEQVLDSISPNPEMLALYTEIFNEKLGDFQKTHISAFDDLAQQLTALKAKLENLEEKFIMDAIDIDTYKKWKVKLENQRTDLQERLNRCEQGKAIKAKVNTVLPFLSNMKEIYIEANAQLKKSILGSIFSENFAFSKTDYRTPELNGVSRLIFLINNQLQDTRKQKKGLDFSNPAIVENTGFEPVTSTLPV